MVRNSLPIFILCCVAFAFGWSNSTQQDVRNHPNYHLLGPETECGEESDHVRPALRMEGGTRVHRGEMPWMVHLYMVWEVVVEFQGVIYHREPMAFGDCGGTLISKRYVLTAAHCTQQYNKIYIYFPQGDYDLLKCPFNEGNLECKDKYDVAERVINHEDYNKPASSGQNDISLLRLSKDVTFNKHLRPICLPSLSDCSKLESLGSTVTAAGWGIIPDLPNRNHNNDSLQKAKLSLEVCMEKYALKNKTTGQYKVSYTIPSQICAGDKHRRGRGICRGDSGGPLVTRLAINGSLKHVQVGISSFGSVCPRRLKTVDPDAFTRVSSFLPWILDHLEE